MPTKRPARSFRPSPSHQSSTPLHDPPHILLCGPPQTWADMGAKNEKELKDLLLKRSLKPVSTLTGQVGCAPLRQRCGCSAAAAVTAGGGSSRGVLAGRNL